MRIVLGLFEFIQQGCQAAKNIYFGEEAKPKTAAPIFQGYADYVTHSTQIRVEAPLPGSLFLKNSSEASFDYNDPFWKTVECSLTLLPTGNPVIIEGESQVYNFYSIARRLLETKLSPETGRPTTLADLRSYKQQEVDARIAKFFREYPNKKVLSIARV